MYSCHILPASLAKHSCSSAFASRRCSKAGYISQSNPELWSACSIDILKLINHYNKKKKDLLHAQVQNQLPNIHKWTAYPDLGIVIIRFSVICGHIHVVLVQWTDKIAMFHPWLANGVKQTGRPGSLSRYMNMCICCLNSAAAVSTVQSRIAVAGQ